MNEQEATVVINMIENHWQRRIDGSRTLWMEFFSGVDSELAVKAVAKLAKTDGHMPRIKDMSEMLGIVAPPAPAIDGTMCPSCHGDKVVLVQTRPPEQTLWMKEHGIEPATDSEFEESMPCPDCNSGADIDYYVLNQRYRPMDAATVRERMSPHGTDPSSERTREVPAEALEWLAEKQKTLLKDIP